MRDLEGRSGSINIMAAAEDIGAVCLFVDTLLFAYLAAGNG